MIPMCQNKLPVELKLNDNLLFHGSSNISEQALDLGQTINYSFIKKGAIKALINVYDTINWKGTHGGGYAVLNSFSNTDWTVDGKRGFFLGESLERCKLYASKDFAGGELIRSVWYSLSELNEYIMNESLRQDHENQMTRDFRYTRKNYDVNLEKLRVEVAGFDKLFNEVTDLRNSYQYGLIYCYEIKQEDYSLLKHRGGMGIMAAELFPEKRVVAKVIITDPLGSGYVRDNIERIELWNKRFKAQ
jgi:hypothetical protein